MRMRIFAHPGAIGCGAASRLLDLEQKDFVPSVGACATESSELSPVPAIKYHRPQ